MKIYTTGVYGTTEDEFFGRLTAHGIDTFCDIRQRRGVRGSQYRYANSKYLQEKLRQLGISYVYERQLAPTRAIRELQWAEDKDKGHTKKYRDVLGAAFRSGYRHQILEQADMDAIYHSLTRQNARHVVLFCVEAQAQACHRSLVAEYLHEHYGVEVKHL